MRLPLRVIHIDFDKRFVDFSVAGRPTSEGTHVSGKAPLPAKKHGKPHSKTAAKVGPPTKHKSFGKGAKEKPKRKKRR
jgi:hypothetical protein